jgi:hypothetical protein
MNRTHWGLWNDGVGAALTAVVLAVGLGACGGSSSSTSTSSSSTSAASPPASSSSTTSSAPASAAPKAGATAAPGAKLTVGQSATVPYTPAGSRDKNKAATLRVTVQSFEKGTLADFNGIKLDANQKASTPIYVKVHVTNLGPNAIDVNSSSAAIEGVDNTGNTQQSVTFIGEFPRCPDKASSTPMPSGSSYDNCLTFLVPGGVTKVAYSGTTDYISSPVTWAPK